MTGFFTGGGKSLSFGNPQDPQAMPQFGNRWRGGRIIEEGKVMPQTDINTGQPILGPDGRPKEQLALPLQADGSGQAAQHGMPTNERNANDHTDTGRRVLYIKGSLRFAVGDAIRAAGATDLQVGGELYVMWTGMGKTGNSKFIGRTWQVKYFPPSGQFFQQEQPQAPSAPAFGQPGVGAMPTQQNGNGQYAPQHTGLAATNTPVSDPYSQQAPAAPPNPYAQPQYVPGDAQHAVTGRPPNQWQAQQGQFPADAATGAAQMTGAAPQSPSAPSNPWDAAPQPPQPEQSPYGQPQTPASPAGNPWG